VLFEADQRSVAVDEILERHIARATTPMNPLVAELVNGVVAHQIAIDETIETYSEGWTIDRMPAVDRALARLGVYEIVFAPETPDAVTIDEVVSLAADISTDESPAFLNGLLARVSKIKHRITVE
jgi:N utilization substance protein B